MKVLIVCSGNSGNISPFIQEQVNELRKSGIQCRFLCIKGLGVIGYLRNYNRLKKKIAVFNPDIVHAHYGLSGLLANLQRIKPVVTTFHGSDINFRHLLPISWITMILSKKSIFVSKKLKAKAFWKSGFVIPCGIDLNNFTPMEKNVCRSKMNLDFNKKYILFSSSFDNPVKNYKLAKEALSQLNYQNLEIIELKNYNRKEVAMLMNASDIGLLTSFSEGSPQFIKEAIACNLPLISTDVGDVKEIIENIEGCYICDFNSFLLAEKIKKVLIDNTRINGGKHVTNFDCKMISEKMTTIYNTIIS